MNPDEVETNLESIAEQLEGSVSREDLLGIANELRHLADWVAHAFVEVEVPEAEA